MRIRTALLTLTLISLCGCAIETYYFEKPYESQTDQEEKEDVSASDGV